MATKHNKAIPTKQTKAVEKPYKRESKEVDKLVAEVDRLHANGMSINRACAQVGIQNTVYYFRKRRDNALAINTKKESSMNEIFSDRDLNDLMREYRELEERLQAIKMAIADKVVSSPSRNL